MATFKLGLERWSSLEIDDSGRFCATDSTYRSVDREQESGASGEMLPSAVGGHRLSPCGVIITVATVFGGVLDRFVVCA